MSEEGKTLEGRITCKSYGCYFYIVPKDIATLISCKASVSDIIAFMLIVRHKIAPTVSSAGYTVLRNKMGIGTEKAISIQDHLQEMQCNGHYLMEQIPEYSLKFSEGIHGSVESYNLKVAEAKRFYKYKRNACRWKINVRVSSAAFFDNELLDKEIIWRKQKIPYPSYLCRMLSNEGAWLLLQLHRFNNEFYDLVSPFTLNVSHDVEYLVSGSGLDIFHAAQSDNLEFPLELVGSIWGIEGAGDKCVQANALSRAKNLLKELEVHKLLKRVVVAFIYDSVTSDEPCEFYELDLKTNYSREKKKHHLLNTAVREFVKGHGVAADRKDSRCYGKYLVAVPEGKCVSVCTTYRLIFSVKSRKAYSEGLSAEASTRARISKLLHGVG